MEEVSAIIQDIIWAIVAFRAVHFLHRLIPLIEKKHVSVKKGGVEVEVE